MFAKGLGDYTEDVAKGYSTLAPEAGTAAMGVKLAASLALMAIPVVGWVGALLINIPVVGDKVMGPIMKPIMGMFKKATHFGDCMKFEWSDDNIRAKVRGVVPYQIDPSVAHEYRLQHASDISQSANARSDVRQRNIGNIFLRIVRQNPDIMSLHCAVWAQSKGENMGVTYSMSQVDEYWNQMKDAARQEEVYNIMKPYIATVVRKGEVVQQTRQAASTFKLPEGVLSISKGAVVLGTKVSSNLTIPMVPTTSAVQSKQVIASPAPTIRL